MNRDGRLDLVVGSHHERARNRVYINEGLRDGVPRFRDVSAQVGLPAELTNKSPHVEIQDFDNDGWPDLYFSTAWLDDDAAVTPLVYRNEGTQKGLPLFKPLRELKKNDRIVYFPAGPSGDYDKDGRVDLFLVNWFRGNHSRLLRNVSPPQRWLDVSVVGRKVNRMGIGSQISVYRVGRLGDPAALLGFQELNVGYGYASGQEAVCHFGLGADSKVDVKVRLSNGRILVKKSVAADQRITIAEL